MMAEIVIKDAQTGEVTVREMTPEEEAQFIPQPPTQEELDAMADALADQVMQQSKDAMRAMGETLAEVVFRVSNGTVPQNVTEAQARTWVRDTFRAKYRALL
jgi:hypothetical protein